MKPSFMLSVPLLALTAMTSGTSLATPASEQLLRQYQGAGAGPFSATTGEQIWRHKFAANDGSAARSCTSCHTADLRAPGKHRRTGKPIAPLAPSANPKRLSETKEIEKWFRRNCKWTLGRLCTPQEKGDLLLFIQAQ